MLLNYHYLKTGGEMMWVPTGKKVKVKLSGRVLVRKGL